MKKAFSIALMLVLFAAMFMPGNALAANVTSYSSGYQIQNLSQTDPANFTITFYNHDGSVALTTPSAQIPAGSFSSFFTLGSVLSSPFDGSAVIASDQPVAAVAFLYGNSNLEHVDTYAGLSGGATTVYLPLIQMNNQGVYSFFNIQNVGSSLATVTVDFPGYSCPIPTTIQPGAAAHIDMTTNVCVPTGPHAATVTSDQPVAVVVVHVKPNSVPFNTKAGILSYNGFTTVGSTNPIFPLVSSGWFGSITGIQIQNTGGSSSDVTVTYTPSAGFPGASCTEMFTIPAGQSKTYAVNSSRLMAPACRTLQAGQTAFVGSARVTGNSANQTLNGIVNNINSAKALASSYDAFAPTAGSTHLAFPLIVDNYNSAFSGISLVNMGSGSANISCTFPGAAFTWSPTVAAGASITLVLQNKINVGGSYLGSAYCSSNQNIVGIVNYNDGLTATDAVGQYAGINY